MGHDALARGVGKGAVTLELGDERIMPIIAEREQGLALKVAVGQDDQTDVGGQQRAQPRQQFLGQLDLALVGQLLALGVGSGVPTLARQGQTQAAGQHQQLPEQEGMRRGGGPAALLLFGLFAVAAGIIRILDSPPRLVSVPSKMSTQSRFGSARRAAIFTKRRKACSYQSSTGKPQSCQPAADETAQSQWSMVASPNVRKA